MSTQTDADRGARDLAAFVAGHPGWRIRAPHGFDLAEWRIILPGSAFALRAWPAAPRRHHNGFWSGSCDHDFDRVTEWYAPQDEVFGEIEIAERALRAFSDLHSIDNDDEARWLIENRLRIRHLRFLRTALGIGPYGGAPIAEAVIFRATGLRTIVHRIN